MKQTLMVIGGWIVIAAASMTMSVWADYDDTPVGKAMSLCSKHEIWSSIQTDPPSLPTHEPEWTPYCEKVRSIWENSETARKQHEAAEQEKCDLEFVKGVAGAK
jgi:hypothetical protein